MNEVEQAVSVATEPPPPARSTPGFWTRVSRRRRFIVDARLQGGLLADFLVQLLAFAIVLIVAVFLPPILVLGEEGAEPSRLLRAARQMLVLHDVFWPALGAAVVLVTLLAVRTSHRIAGPLFRFRRVYEALLRGENPGPVRLRRGDYLKPEAEFLERVARSVARDRARLTRLEDGVRESLEQLERDLGSGGDQGLEGVRRRLTDVIRESDPAR
jgi:hypothetical protein